MTSYGEEETPALGPKMTLIRRRDFTFTLRSYNFSSEEPKYDVHLTFTAPFVPSRYL